MKYLMILLFLVGMLDSTIAWGYDCKTHKIYCKIVKLQPSIDKQFAIELSDKLYRKAKKYNLDPLVSLAILNQESSLRNLNTFSSTKKVSKSCSSTGCTKTVVEEHEVLDMTIAQINIHTALGYGFDVERLFNLDLDYALECHFKVLSDKIEQCDWLAQDAWSCYHSVTPKHRLKYVSMVKRFL